jgi:hypothetical protein
MIPLLLLVLLLLCGGCSGMRSPEYFQRRGMTACLRYVLLTPLGTVEQYAIVATGEATMGECVAALGP